MAARWSAGEERFLREQAAAGVPVQDIAHRLGKTAHAVYCHAREHGVNIVKRPAVVSLPHYQHLILEGERRTRQFIERAERLRKRCSR